MEDLVAEKQPADRNQGLSWAKAMVLIAVIVNTGALAGLYMVTSGARQLIKPILGDEVARNLFSSYVVGLQGKNHLQVAELKTIEEFGISSEKKLLRIFPGGTVEVSAKIPCDIVYHVPLKDAEWQFFIRDNGRRLIVVAPLLAFNRPAVDLGSYELRVDKSSMIRDSEEVKALLQSQIPGFLEEVGRKNIESIKDTARLAIKSFVENWLLNSLQNKNLDQPVVDRVYFKDEEALYAPIILQPAVSSTVERNN